MESARWIAEELGLNAGQVERTLALFAEGATLPFIARYRKEVTGGLDEVQIGTIKERGDYFSELLQRKQTVLAQIESVGALTDELRRKITATRSRIELEDLYLPYKPKRRTRAQQARERGLGPLAERMMQQNAKEPGRDELAAPFLNAEVADTEAAFAGARDILAEQIAERPPLRAALRAHALSDGILRARVAKNKETEGAKFKDYFDWHEPIAKIPSHRVLAVFRGEEEKFLRVALELKDEMCLGQVRDHFGARTNAALQKDITLALTDAYERLLQPAIENDVRENLKERADRDAIVVFAENLRNLLLQAPLGTRPVLAIDPGFRTGCKVVALDALGNLLAHDVIFPTQSEAKQKEAATRVAELCKKHTIAAVAVGNGTAGRETESWLRGLGLTGIELVVVNEAGASVYSASEVAREEFPDQDVTVRGAVSIGRRLQDPLAELVKIDPKSIGVGQYQHDVNQTWLKTSLDQVVERCVNHVGVDVNTASAKLLQYVAGLGETIAGNLVEYRKANGPFASRAALQKVPRLGKKAFEQAAGFLRVRSSKNPLDNSAVHPESYDVAERMAKDLGVPLAAIVGDAARLKQIDPQRYTDERRGLPTVKDIVAELEKPGRDPRASFESVGFDANITAIEHLREGQLLPGIVTNVTQFGAFVDVGVHQDGLVHISELAHRFVKQPAEVVKVGDRVRVKVLAVDLPRKRISLSIKQASAPPAQGSAPKPVAASSREKSPQQNKPTAPKAPEPFNNPFAKLRR